MSFGAIAPPDSRPTTRPVEERVHRLIVQLGDEDFRLRDEASAELAAMGDAVADVLRLARETDDPEIATRVEVLLRRIDERAAARIKGEGAAALAVHHFVVIEKDRGQGTIEAKNDVRDAVVLERVNTTNQYRVVMHRDNSKISIALTAIVEGEAKTEQYAAASEAELKEKHPKLYEVHEALLKALDPNDEMRGWWRQFAPRPEGPGRKRIRERP